MFFGPWLGSMTDAPIWLQIAIVVIGVAVLAPGWVKFVRDSAAEGERRRRIEGMRELAARAAARQAAETPPRTVSSARDE